MPLCEYLKPKCTINKKLLPVKLHYLFYALGLGSIMTYFPLIAKDIGISATGFGIVYTIVPFAVVVISPMFGYITDRYKNIKIIVMILVLLQVPFYFGLNYIPPIQKHLKFFNADLKCSNNNSHFVHASNFSTLPKRNEIFECQTNCSECLSIKLNETSNYELICGKTLNLETKQFDNGSSQYLSIQNMFMDSKRINTSYFNCTQRINEVCSTTCFVNASEDNTFTSYQFWVYLVLLATALIATDVSIALSDAACHEELKGRINQFGKQRVWLSIGWGLISLITGYVVDAVNEGGGKKTDYSYCFYMMVPLMIIDMICITQTDMKKQKSSKNIPKDVGKIFTTSYPFIFIFAVFIVGISASLCNNYKFWYLEDLGASKLLLGLDIAVNCLTAEVPFMFLSGWISKRIGRDNCMCFTFTAFSIWFLSSAYMYNPWWILPVEIFQGPTYGLFWSVMSSYAKSTAPPGTEATLQTMLGATYHGLGIGCGSLLGGLGFDIYGTRSTFRFYGFFCIGVAVIYKFTTILIVGDTTVDVCKREDQKKEDEIIKAAVENTEHETAVTNENF